jgi:acetamidase/formamidase
MQRFPATDLKSVYSPFHEPHGRVADGETFQVETEDCFGGRFRDPSAYTSENIEWVEENLDVVTGPICVEGAKSGDVVALRIDAIEVTTPGTVVIGPFTDPSPDDWWLDEEHAMALAVQDGFVCLGDRLRIPVRPVIGCLATAPKQEVVLSRHEDRFGGNQDCNPMTAGSTVVLPVNVDGAFLYFGDCKARMADGEIGAAPEVGTLVTATACIRPRPASMRWPRIETDSELMTVVSDISLADACRQAFREMMLWIEEDTRAERHMIVLLMAMVADTAVCQVSNRLHTARCTMPRGPLSDL